MITKMGITRRLAGDTLVWLWPWLRNYGGKYYSLTFNEYFKSIPKYWMKRGELDQALNHSRMKGVSFTDIVEYYTYNLHPYDKLIMVKARDILNILESSINLPLPPERQEILGTHDTVFFKMDSAEEAINLMNNIEHRMHSENFHIAFIDKGRVIRVANFGTIPSE